MANLERGAHEPDNVYAFDPNSGVDEDAEASRLPLLIAIALVVLAAFAGVVWLAYTQGVEEGRADAPRVAVVQHAAPPPIHHTTAKPQPNPYAGLNIYQPVANSADANAAPPPSSNHTGAAPATTAPALRPSAAPNVETPPVMHPAPKAVPAPRSIATPETPKPQNTADAAAPPLPAPVQVPKSAAPQPAPAESTSPAGVMLQIGSYKSAAEARASWTHFKARHPGSAAYSPDVRQADLGAKGTWYRLRIGAFADKHAASAFCEQLKAQGASCIVAR